MENIEAMHDKLKEYQEIKEVIIIINEKELLYNLYFNSNNERFNKFIVFLRQKYKNELLEENFKYEDLKNKRDTYEYFDKFLLKQGLKKIYKHFHDEEVKQWIN